MPTLENPTFYDRAAYIAASRADDFLRDVSPDYFDAQDGDVDSPFGHVSLVEITRDDIASYVSREGDPWMSERRNFEPGWYLIRLNSDGLIWGMFYSTEQDARDDFAELEEAYGEWLDIVDGPDGIDTDRPWGDL